MRALVTGGGRGYGAVVAKHLASAGFEVAVLGRNGRDLEKLSEEIAGIALVADVLDVAALESAIATLLETGPIDTLVNNAGVGGVLGLGWEVDPDEWWRAVEVNLRGTHNVTRLLVPSMVERGAGRIINVVSNAGVGRWPYGSSYAVSKAAVIKYGENLAAELRKRGIAVLNYHPGILEIGLTATLFDSDPSPGTTDHMVAEWFREQIASGRSVDAEVSAAGLLRLASGEFDELTGRYLTAYDDLDDIAARRTAITTSELYTLGLLTGKSASVE